MRLNIQEIDALKDNILKEILRADFDIKKTKTEDNSVETTSPVKRGGIFDCIDRAVEEAKKAQKILFGMKLQMRELIIEAIRREATLHIEDLSKLAVEETGMGRVEDKILKNRLVINNTPGLEDLKAFAITGDDGLTVMELSPYGVIGAITPSTNPSETILCNSIGMIAAGNSVVFAPHPGAKKTSLMTIEIINKAIKSVGGPENLVVSINNPSIEGTNRMMKNKEIKMLVATGGPAIVEAVMSTGKKAIGAGAGNPPVLVDASADIEKAARDIISGASLDNNLPCIAEKVVVTVEDIADYLMFEMQKRGAYLIKDENLVKKLEDLVIPQGKPNRKYIGKDAGYILEELGIVSGDDTRIIIVETKKDHPLAVEEQLMPVLPIVRVKDEVEGLELCKKLEGGLRHTAMIHSKNIDVLTKYARDMETTILVKNGPSYAGIGFNGEGYSTFTIAGPTGEGLTSARTFARNRRCVLVGGLSIK